MARKPRIHVPGGVYHVILRGNRAEDIFFGRADHYHLYLLLQQGIERYGHRVHAFCCMNNHIHMAIQVADIPLAKIIQNLSFRYTRWINRRKGRNGHLFQGRYKAILVDTDSYLLELVRYIHLNPVRAKLVRDPTDYPWSGHLCYLGEEYLPWLHTEWVLAQFGKRLRTCRNRYNKFIASGIGEGHREEFHRGGDDVRVLANDRFLETVLRERPVQTQVPDIRNIVRYVCQRYEIPETALTGPSRARRLSEARALIGWFAAQTRAATLAEVAERFSRDATTLSRRVSQLDCELRSSKTYTRDLARHINAIMQA